MLAGGAFLWLLIAVSLASAGDAAALLAFAALSALVAAHLFRRSEVVRFAATSSAAALASRAEVLETAEAWIRAGRPGAFGMIDLDGFRLIRREQGPERGQAVLSAVAERLAHHLPLGAIGCWFEADQFAVILPDAGEEDAARYGDDLRRILSRPYLIGGDTLTVPMSMGLVALGAGTPALEETLHLSQLALERAKALGGRQSHLLKPAEAQEAARLAELQRDLPGGLERGEFVPFYQPVIDLASGEVAGLEVLARWQHPRFGLLGPTEFIPIADRQRLCGELSLELLRQVAQDIRAWPAHWKLAFNTTPSQLRELLEFSRRGTPISPDVIDLSRVELEVTETALIQEFEIAREVVRAMHRRGIKVALDDFGMGYANFLHLRELPFDRVKIDRSFVVDMAGNERARACVQAMLAMARSLGATVTAEGVETEEIAAMLRAFGCDFGQGFLYAEPLTADDITRRFASCALEPVAA